MRHVLKTIVLAGVLAAPAAAITPVYSRQMSDCNTGPNQTLKNDGKYGWSVSAGCDSYQNEFYERPTTQSFEDMTKAGGGKFWGAKEYYENLDIVRGKAGVDATYLYTAIKMNGLDNITEDGTQTFQSLFYKYFVTLSKSSDGANGVLFWVDQPSLANDGKEETPNTVFSPLKTFGARDTNGDVGGSGLNNGISITKSNNANAAVGDGFDLSIISDGQLQTGNKPTILYARINPNDHTEVEFALNYTVLGFTRQEIENIINGISGYFDLRSAKGGPKDPQNFMWNDEYTLSEAGSPYKSQSSNGTQNIYEVDTMRWNGSALEVVPEPATWLTMITGFGMVGAMARRRQRVRLA